MNAETRLAELKLQLPPTPKAMGLYKSILVVGSFAYVSGHAPIRPDGTRVVGKVGGNFTLDEGKEAARCCGNAILATLRHGLGSLNRVKQVVKILGMVNATDNFRDHPAVINGCSELFVEIFGPDHGVGVRSAAGMSSLPGGIAVEIEAVFEIE